MTEQSKGPQTVQEAATALVEKTAARLIRRRYGDPAWRGITREAIRAQLWGTEEGLLLRSLYHEFGDEPVAKLRGRVLKAKGEEKVLIRKGLELLDAGVLDYGE